MNEENYIFLSEREKYWINKFSLDNKNKGYNLTSGGIALLSVDNPYSKFSTQ